MPKRDYNPETTMFLWCINKQGGKNEVVLSDIYKTLTNLRRRKALEVAKHSAMLSLADRAACVLDDVHAARRFRLVLDHLDKASVNTCRMLRLFHQL